MLHFHVQVTKQKVAEKEAKKAAKKRQREEAKDSNMLMLTAAAPAEK